MGLTSFPKLNQACSLLPDANKARPQLEQGKPALVQGISPTVVTNATAGTIEASTVHRRHFQAHIHQYLPRGRYGVQYLYGDVLYP